MPSHTPDTDELLLRAEQGDAQARQTVLVRHRDRLKLMVSLHLDRRLAARIDPSDVVQEALLQAAQNLDQYLHERPLPFYPWLRQLAWKSLIDLHRRHLHAKRRSVRREEPLAPHLSDQSAMQLAERVLIHQSSPSQRAIRSELRSRIRAALDRLGERDREVLVLRNLEQLSTKETAAVLGIREGSVKTRHLRALERLRALLEPESEGEN
ncbi:MAG TPA: sigma-70 family RNA polymerase sigma factor [Gemmataceae bacterium]|nr:sigma-70 family RNA polymerase sigma factor [Gemmataceae bacterium]